MKWKLPPKIKIYEALGCLADNRVLIDGNSASVKSSSGNKAYSITYDPGAGAIMANDNGSFWHGYLGYPAIAFLMAKKIVKYSPKIAALLSGIAWKDINTKFKNNWEQTEDFVLKRLSSRDQERLQREVDEVYNKIKELNLSILGKKIKPPSGY